MSKQLTGSEVKNNGTFQIDQLIRIALIVALTYWSFQLIIPFIGLLAWSFILSVALYPVFNWLNRRIGNHSTLAATIITLLSLLIVVGMLVLLTNNIVESINDLTIRIRSGQQIIPQLPATIKEWPAIGDSLQNIWSLTSSNVAVAIKKYSSYLINAGSYSISIIANKSIDLILFILSVIFSGYLLVHWSYLLDNVRKLAERISPKRGSDFINIVKKTIQNVSRGVIGVSILQTLLFGLLLLIAGTPGAGLISFIALILCIAQLGLTLVVIPVVVWLFFTKSVVIAIIFTILLFLVTLIDNILKPLILARGLRTPMIIIFLGVLGGVLLHGVIGVFIGPVVLAIFYDLVCHWLVAEDM